MRMYVALTIFIIVFILDSSNLPIGSIISLAYLKVVLLWGIPLVQIYIHCRLRVNKWIRDFLITLFGVVAAQLIEKFMHFELVGDAKVLNLITWVPAFIPWIMQGVDHILDGDGQK